MKIRSAIIKSSLWRRFCESRGYQKNYCQYLIQGYMYLPRRSSLSKVKLRNTQHSEKTFITSWCGRCYWVSRRFWFGGMRDTWNLKWRDTGWKYHREGRIYTLLVAVCGMKNSGLNSLFLKLSLLEETKFDSGSEI